MSKPRALWLRFHDSLSQNKSIILKILSEYNCDLQEGGKCFTATNYLYHRVAVNWSQ